MEDIRLLLDDDVTEDAADLLIMMSGDIKDEMDKLRSRAQEVRFDLATMKAIEDSQRFGQLELDSPARGEHYLRKELKEIGCRLLYLWNQLRIIDLTLDSYGHSVEPELLAEYATFGYNISPSFTVDAGPNENLVEDHPACC